MINPFFDFVIVIICLSFAFKLVDAWLKNRARTSTEEPARSELLKRLDEVEERVRVLERIVTDERFDLKQQFRDLETGS
jgi:hypothetical protein